MNESTEPAPYFELALTHIDGRQIPPEQFLTVQDAMTAAMEYDGVRGSILLYSQPGADPVEVIVYDADGSIAVGAGVPDDEFEDEPWTRRNWPLTSLPAASRPKPNAYSSVSRSDRL